MPEKHGTSAMKMCIRDRQEAYVSGYSSKVVDTTGAGDSFMGGFLYKISESGKRIEEYSDVYKRQDIFRLN